jgi:tetratricopeptide (TPR) repeat protein
MISNIKNGPVFSFFKENFISNKTQQAVIGLALSILFTASVYFVFKAYRFFQAKRIRADFERLPTLTLEKAPEIVQKCQALLTIDPTNIEALSMQAEALFCEAPNCKDLHAREQKFKEALTIQEEVITRTSEGKILRASIIYSLANFYAQLQNFEGALNFINQVELEEDGTSLSISHKAKLYEAKAVILVATHESRQAKEMFMESFRLNPTVSVAYEIAQLYEKERNFEEAKSYYKKSIALDACRVESAIKLAIIHMNEGQNQQAESLLRSVLVLSPYHETAVSLMSGILQSRNQTNELIQLHLKFAQHFSMQENFERAIIYFSAACEIDPENHSILAGLGECYAKQKNWLKALEKYQAAVELDHTNLIYSSRIAYLQDKLSGQEENVID